ncbi:MAG TPA: xylulokinase [Anaerolinea thermolimosa]|uniref:Xylulose kinase n=1 Tax=Anaerolinea thermolimosa TaxID=229919 RepID=A0A3D1JEY7_9CHLR|nr:xylulokinase [Anaerolinea thermolimosa]
MEVFLGIDVSTTGVKALLVGRDGSVVGSATTEQPLFTPHPLWSEQNPEDWWKGAVQSIREVLRSTGVSGADVVGIGLTGQMHGLTLLDEAGQVLRPAILWNDQRTGPQCDEIRARLGRERLIQITGNDALTGFTAPKILWVQENEPEVYRKIRHILLPKDYVRYRLTGEFAVDRADGSGTILFDLHHRDWSPEMLAALGISLDWLPKTYEGPEVTGRITAEAAQLTGLREGTPVCAGGGDQAAQAVGVGAVRPGIVALTLGTSGVVFATTDQAYIEKEGRLHAFCHAVPGRWHLMGVMLSAAGSLRWYHDNFTPDLSYDALIAPAGDVPAGAEGLLFLPYLTGERTPHPDPLARGAFAGLTIRHGMAHMTRAVLEGVAFGLRDSFELMRSAGLTQIEQVRVSGGGARSPIWRQILADVFNVELVTVNTTEGAAYGAALLAGVGVGVWPSVDAACAATVRSTGATHPRAEQVKRYEKIYPLYRQLYPTLKELTHQLSSV